jgi:hypothetical protein
VWAEAVPAGDTDCGGDGEGAAADHAFAPCSFVSLKCRSVLFLSGINGCVCWEWASSGL